MVNAFFEYVRNISFYLLFVAFAGVLLPSGNYKKYVNLVLGVVMIGVFLAPLVRFSRFDTVPVTEWFARFSPNLPYPDISAPDQRDRILTHFHAQLHEQIAVLMPRHGFALVASEWETSEDFRLTGARLTVQTLASEPAAESRPFIRIEPIRIPGSEPTAPEETDPTDKTLPIKKWLSDFYNIPLANIHVIIKNGG